MAFIELKNVSFTYPDASYPALKDVSLKVEKGEFITLFGASGSGKSTLLRLLKKEIQPHGELFGKITMNGHNEIGFVFQDPENQVVAESVLQEVAFGLENMALPPGEMRNRMAEMAHYFGAERLLNRKTEELSGGKKQQMNLASVLLMQPDLLLLDEPTSQLDPVSSKELLDMLVRLNEEFGMTIILAEHRLEEISALCDRMVLMDEGTIVMNADAKTVMREIWNLDKKLYVPSIPSFYLESVGQVSSTIDIPLTVKEGKKWLETKNIPSNDEEKLKNPRSSEVVLKAEHLFFKYGSKSDWVMDNLSISLQKGDIYALLGGNGSGKSTLFKALCGSVIPENGKIVYRKERIKPWKNPEFIQRIGYLPQNPKLFFLHDTVGKELEATMKRWSLQDYGEVDHLLNELGISHLVNRHPYDLSGGELQKAALACLLLPKPEILLLDEPTKGLDPVSKRKLGERLMDLRNEGMTILMSTHDLEFAANYATVCGMMFQGQITSEEIPERFFKGNFFYTTMIQRLFRGNPMHSFITLEEANRSCVRGE